MQRDRSSMPIRLAVLGCLLVFALWLVLGGLSRQNEGEVLDIAKVPQQYQDVPGPQSTSQPTIMPSPTWPVIPTPTVKVWPTPVPVVGMAISTMDQVEQVGMSEKERVDRSYAISQIIWAPTGDKWLYVTTSGDLYWSNVGGGNATLIHHYSEIFNQLEEQRPPGNTLLVRHLGVLQTVGRETTHMDVVNFTPGMPPTITEGPALTNPPHHLHWWSADRASGIAHTGYDGGDMLVTLDASGNLVEELNVPYMLSGAVRPGGRWLAYATTYQVANTLDSSSPQTVYLLDMTTGERKRVTSPGQGNAVGSWSPNGDWFLMASEAGVSIVSADLSEQIIIPEGSIDAVWSPDSRYLAFTIINGESTDGHTVTSWTGKTFIVNVPEREVINEDTGGPGAGAGSDSADDILWQPKWSPDSSRLAFLSFDPACPFECSKLAPAIFHMLLNE